MSAAFQTRAEPNNEQIAHAHKRAYRLADGPKTYAEHCAECVACGSLKAFPVGTLVEYYVEVREGAYAAETGKVVEAIRNTDKRRVELTSGRTVNVYVDELEAANA